MITFISRGRKGTDRLTNMPKTTQPVAESPWNQEVWLRSLCSEPPHFTARLEEKGRMANQWKWAWHGGPAKTHRRTSSFSEVGVTKLSSDLILAGMATGLGPQGAVTELCEDFHVRRGGPCLPTPVPALQTGQLLLPPVFPACSPLLFP